MYFSSFKYHRLALIDYPCEPHTLNWVCDKAFYVDFMTVISTILQGFSWKFVWFCCFLTFVKKALSLTLSRNAATRCNANNE